MSFNFRKMFWGTSFVRTPLQNGVGRFVPQLQRITLKFCKEYQNSLGMRDYIEKDLIHFARENPGVVVYVKPRRHRAPCLKAEYLNGGEEYVSCHEFSRGDIVTWMDILKGKSGLPTKPLLKDIHTNHPSIQGAWTPFVNKDPEINTSEFPNPRLNEIRDPRPTGTEELLELYRRQQNASEVEDSQKES